MVKGKLGRNQLEKLLAENSKLALRTSYVQNDTQVLVRLSLKIEDNAKSSPEKLESEADSYALLQGLAVFTTAVMLAASSVSDSAVMWAIALSCGLGVLGFHVLARKLRKSAKNIRRLREDYGEWEFARPVQQSWYEAAKDDQTIAWMVTQWLLTLLEIDFLKQRIQEGSEAREELAFKDPLRARLQVEIDTLRTRFDQLCTSAGADAERINEQARDHSDARRRDQLTAKRRAEIAAAEAASVRDLEQKMISMERSERNHLAKQERAHRWLYDDPEK